MTKYEFANKLAEAILKFYKDNKMDDQIIRLEVSNVDPEIPMVHLVWKELSTFLIELTILDDFKIEEVVDGDKNFAQEFDTIEAYIEFLHELFEV